MTLHIAALTGDALIAAVPDLAKLRIAVFAAYPYLYVGDAAYEAVYLREFIAAPDSVLIAALDGDRIVGAATASPMWEQKAEFREPFEQRGLNTARLFYFGESVLLPKYRGKGIGHAFFVQREQQARAYQASAATFAAVVRPPDHPAMPANYVPLDAFWRKRGYAPVDGLTTQLAWQEFGENHETPKTMQYWMRDL